MTAPHPAVYSDALMPIFQDIINGWRLDRGDGAMPRVLDPFAGTGKIHSLVGAYTYGIEIEPEWASMHERTFLGDALALDPLWYQFFDMVITSPTYGNRMADSHDAKDGSTRITYTHKLGRKLHPHNSGAMQWGERYKEFHHQAWEQVHKVLKPHGYFVLNIKDHIRGGKIQQVTRWHHETLVDIGFLYRFEKDVPTPGMGFGANGQLRVDHESVLVYEKV